MVFRKWSISQKDSGHNRTTEQKTFFWFPQMVEQSLVQYQGRPPPVSSTSAHCLVNANELRRGNSTPSLQRPSDTWHPRKSNGYSERRSWRTGSSGHVYVLMHSAKYLQAGVKGSMSELCLMSSLCHNNKVRKSSLNDKQRLGKAGSRKRTNRQEHQMEAEREGCTNRGGEGLICCLLASFDH